MTETSVATNALQALQVVGDGSSEITFHHDLLIDDVVGYKTEFLFVQILGSPIWVDTRFFEYLLARVGPMP